MIKNIIFDWSGVLSDDFERVSKIVNVVFKEQGIKPFTKKEMKNKFFLPYIKFYEKYLSRISGKEAAKEFAKLVKFAPKPKPYPKIRSILSFLKKRKIKLIVLSAYLRRELIKEAKEYGVSDFVDKVYATVHDKTKIIKKILTENKLKKEETVYVGDMVHDIEAAKHAGIKIVAVSYGYQSRSKLEKENPDFIIDDLEEIKGIINSIR